MVEQDRMVKVGSLVEVEDGELNEAWRIAVADEADPRARLISEDTPLARALLGHRAGERVRVGKGSCRGVHVDHRHQSASSRNACTSAANWL